MDPIKRRRTLIPAALCASVFAASGLNAAEFVPLGPLTDGPDDFFPLAVSKDGNTLVGFVGQFGSGTGAIWRVGDEISLLETPAEYPLSEITGISYDGNVLVGDMRTDDFRIGASRGFRWTRDNGLQDLGQLPEGSDQEVYDVSADGSIIVGSTTHYDAPHDPNGGYSPGIMKIVAFRWTQQDGMQSLGDLPGAQDVEFSYPFAISADGSTIVGEAFSDTYEAFVWTEAEGMVGIGHLPLPGGTYQSRATAVSEDGSVVAGFNASAEEHATSPGYFTQYAEAFRWTRADGMVGLGDLPGGDYSSFASGISPDGKVIVGTGSTDIGEEAFRWTEGDGIHRVVDWLEVNGVGVGDDYQLTSATDVSEDGTVIIGRSTNADGRAVAYVARVNSLGNGIAELNSLSVGVMEAAAESLGSASTTTILNGAHSRPLSRRVRSGESCAWIAGDWGVDNHQQRDGDVALGEIGLCYNFGAVQTNLSLGKTRSRQDLTEGGRLELDTHYAYLEALAPVFPVGEGHLWLVAGVLGQWGDFDSRRDYSGGSRDHSFGETDTRSWSTRLRLELTDVLHTPTIDINPYLDWKYHNARVDQYVESGGGFPASYDEREDQFSELALGVNGKFRIGSGASLIGLLEAGHRYGNHPTTVSGDIVGITGFSYTIDALDDDWVRGGVGIEAKLGHGIGKVMLNGTSDGGVPSAWLAMSYQHVF